MTDNRITTLLVIEDNPGDARLLREMLSEQLRSKTTMTHVERMSDAESHLKSHPVDVILLDLGLPDVQGLEAVRRAHAAAPRVPLVVLTGTDDDYLAAQALQEGAQDYLIKGQIEPRALTRALRYAIERNAMEEALFIEKEQAQVTLKSIGEAVACTDKAGNITFLNLAAETVTGWSFAEAAGQAIATVLPIRDADSRDLVTDPCQMASRQREASAVGILIRRDGSEIAVEESIAEIHDRTGNATGAVVVFRDVTTARAMSQEMTYSAQHDFLTSLPNRMLLTDRIEQAVTLAARHQKHAAVLFLDLDGFKHINDSLGHPIGDKLLKSVATRLAACVRESDTVSRQGGDEFVVLLSEIERAEDAAITATRILQSVAMTHDIDQQDLHITTSIGISVYPDDGQNAEALIQNADTAMYQAKEGGRHTYRFFKPAMNVRAVERQFIEESLRNAIERQELALHYQPQVNIRTGAIIGAEALIRWTHPTRGPIAPVDFISIAEDCGLIVPIGHWVLSEACRQSQAWTDAGLRPIPMAVNVSAAEFQNEGFLDGVLSVLAETGLDPHLLELELTESVLMKRVDATAAILQSLRERGVRIAVDDFGTGYSSLSYLRHFPVDALKIDQSFIRQISTDGDDTTLVAAVISMANSLKLRVIAEGVETHQELAFIQAHHCDEAQGYYFSRPIPADQFGALLASGLDSVHNASAPVPVIPTRRRRRAPAPRIASVAGAARAPRP